MPQFLIALIALIIFSLFGSTVFAQDSRERTHELISELRKTKHKKKEKKGITTESYLDINSQPVVKGDVRQYAGVYESSDDNFRLELRVSPDGRVEGNGHDAIFFSGRSRNFTLRDARIDGALLTATKIYADGGGGGGGAQKFEAVFNDQTRVEGKNPQNIYRRETRYGLGFIYNYQTSQIDSTSRVFLEYKP